MGEQRVYDIEVEGTHNFVAQGIVAHNTYIQQPTIPGSPAIEESFSSAGEDENIKEASSGLAPKESRKKDGASLYDTGGIDLSNIELTLSRLVIKSEAGSRPLLDILAGKDEKFVSSLNPADLKVLRAAKALKDEWNSLSLLYVHEIMLLLKDNLIQDMQNKELLLNILNQLKLKEFLDPQALKFLQFIQSQKPLSEIKVSLLN